MKKHSGDINVWLIGKTTYEGKKISLYWQENREKLFIETLPFLFTVDKNVKKYRFSLQTRML